VAVQKASALPRKRFFIEMFTRDISLVDCILDLVDNAIDGLIRLQDIDLLDGLLVEQDALTHAEIARLPNISIKISRRQVVVSDNCGGISFANAKNDVFNFGHSSSNETSTQKGQLGVYGIGLKRAIFKLGNSFEMSSNTSKDGFIVEIPSLDNWALHDSRLEDWTFPIQKIIGAVSSEKAGSTIKVTKLREEVVTAISSSVFINRLVEDIGQVYALFLNRFVTIKINGKMVSPIPIPIGQSEAVSPAHKILQEGSVTIKLIAGLAAKNSKEQWKAARAGWYVACNGRLVVVADKSEITGWGSVSLPNFHTKYRGFVGLAIFQSANPLDLPWKTSKRGLNEENTAYQRVRSQMRILTRSILSFLDRMYPSDLAEEPRERAIADGVTSTDVRRVMNTPQTSFTVENSTRRKSASTNKIQFAAKKTDIQKIRKHLCDPEMSAVKIGQHVFQYFLKKEGLE